MNAGTVARGSGLATLPLPVEIAFHFRKAVNAPVPKQRLADLAPGERAVVQAVDTGSPLGRRLLDLGFRPGTPLRVLRRAPLGDPISYELRGTQLCLRRSEARHISVLRTPGDW